MKGIKKYIILFFLFIIFSFIFALLIVDKNRDETYQWEHIFKTTIAMILYFILLYIVEQQMGLTNFIF